jgi:hypothetical protein
VRQLVPRLGADVLALGRLLRRDVPRRCLRGDEDLHAARRHVHAERGLLLGNVLW